MRKSVFGALVPLAAMVAGCVTGGGDSASSLAGTSWRLAHFQSEIQTVPPRLENYTVEFLADGTAAFQLDCNRMSSQWSSSRPGAITFGPGAMTRAFCGEDSWDTRISGDIESVRSYTIAGNTLSLKAGSGSYVWTRKAP